MGLLERLQGSEEPKLPVHGFPAAVGEYLRGAGSRAQLAATYELSAAESTQLDNWLDRVQEGHITRQQVEDVLILLEDGVYTIAFAKTRLEG